MIKGDIVFYLGNTALTYGVTSGSNPGHANEFCKRENIRYALTGFSGSTRYAPAVRYQRAAAYVEQDFEKMIESIDIKAVDSGANVLLLKPYDEGVFYGKQEQNGSIIVLAVQNYLDLSSFRGRGQEAAEKLLEKAVLKKW